MKQNTWDESKQCLTRDRIPKAHARRPQFLICKRQLYYIVNTAHCTTIFPAQEPTAIPSTHLCFVSSFLCTQIAVRPPPAVFVYFSRRYNLGVGILYPCSVNCNDSFWNKRSYTKCECPELGPCTKTQTESFNPEVFVVF